MFIHTNNIYDLHYYLNQTTSSRLLEKGFFHRVEKPEKKDKSKKNNDKATLKEATPVAVLSFPFFYCFCFFVFLFFFSMFFYILQLFILLILIFSNFFSFSLQFLLYQIFQIFMIMYDKFAFPTHILQVLIIKQGSLI